MTHLQFHHVSFRYESMTTELIDHLDCMLSGGWTGVVGANGVGKSTLLQLATQELTPDSGHVISPESGVYCPQRTDFAPLGLSNLLDSTEGNAFKIRGQLALQDDWVERWQTLSHGERKRAQIATALWKEPQLLAIDEPTNHLDIEAKRLLVGALKSYRGVGLLVSHDRDLLDDLCEQCLFMDPPQVDLRPGTYSLGAAQKTLEDKSQVAKRGEAKRVLNRVQQEQSKRRELASGSHQLRSKKGLAIKDHDAKFKKNVARYSGKDGQAGKLLNQLGGRVQRATETLDSTRTDKQYSLGIWLDGEESRRPRLFYREAHDMEIGIHKLSVPALVIGPNDRVAITGANGSGKSSLLLNMIECIDLPEGKLTYIPQEVSQTESLRIMNEVHNLGDKQLGHLMTIVSRLGSRPTRLLESKNPSPGEVRKLMLALGISNRPHLIVMDEPTNHLDLPSIECLEQALIGCPCALILVSHDERFLGKLTEVSWHISTNVEADFGFSLRVKM